MVSEEISLVPGAVRSPSSALEWMQILLPAVVKTIYAPSLSNLFSREVAEAGAFAVTLECVPSELAAEITAALKIPTVGIGAGPVCDAQWLVMHDLLGLNEGHVPSFVKKYANLAEEVKRAFSAYVSEVASGTFPVVG